MPAATGIVLAGGRSSRMGTPKATLEWHGSTLLRRTVDVLGRAVDGPVIVVRAPGQVLPALPATVEVADDADEGRGPLQGIAAGLGAVAHRAPIAFVSAVDLPFLHPAFVARVLAGLTEDSDSDWDIALPHAHGFPQPLSAAYRPGLAPLIVDLLAAGEHRPAALFARCRVRDLDAAMLLADPDLTKADPLLDSVLNVNTPAEYAAARARPAPEVLVTHDERASVTVRAATLRAAAAAAGVELGPETFVTLNGLPLSPDGEMALLPRDVIALGAT